MKKMREKTKEIAIILAKDCPHCRQLFTESKIFKAITSRVLTHIYDIQDEILIHEATALFAGITEKERMLWGLGQQRGTLKTPMFVEVDMTRGVVRADVGVHDDYSLWLTFNTMLGEMGEPRLPAPGVKKKKKEKKKEEKKK